MNALEAENLRPPADVGELNQRLQRYVQEQRQGRVVLLGISVGTTETAVAHGQRRVPKMFHATPDALVTVAKSRAADATCVYLIASTACACDIEVVF